MTSARHRCFSLLMAKDWFTSCIPTSRYDSATSNNNEVGTLVVDGWVITFGTARRGLGGLRHAYYPLKFSGKEITICYINTYKFISIYVTKSDLFTRAFLQRDAMQARPML